MIIKMAKYELRFHIDLIYMMLKKRLESIIDLERHYLEKEDNISIIYFNAQKVLLTDILTTYFKKRE